MAAARALRIVTLGLLALALLWAVGWVRLGWPWVALVGALAIAGSHAAVLAIEFVLLAAVHRDDPAPPAGAPQLLRAWWAETRVFACVFGWTQPHRWRRYPDRLDPPGRRGVVLVHGFFCNRGLWNPWLRRLHAAQVPAIAIDLPAVFAPIDDGVATLDAAVARIEAATGLPPVLVAHSMGGLVVRAWLDRHAADARVHRVVTIGSPHHGTWLARFAVAANARQMRRAGTWLAALAAREPAARMARFTCFYSHCDNIVFPASTATLPGADNRHLPGIAHVQMAYQAEVLDEVMRWLSSPATGTPSSLSAAASLPAR